MVLARGAIRDQLACVKTVVDLVTRPEPRELKIADEPVSGITLAITHTVGPSCRTGRVCQAMRTLAQFHPP